MTVSYELSVKYKEAHRWLTAQFSNSKVIISDSPLGGDGMPDSVCWCLFHV